MTPQPGMETRVVLVTGAGRGIGRAIAERFGRDGYRVVVNDLRRAPAKEVAEAVVRAGGEALAVAADVGRKSAVDRLFASVEERFGEVEVLVNNAGITDAMRHFLEADEAWWDMILRTNLKSVFLCSHRAASRMAERGAGCIINLSSGGATKAHRGFAAYDASKGGIEALTRAMAVDLAPYGIRVNCLVPGSIDTSDGKLPAAVRRSRGRTIPLGRMGSPEDLAGMAAFLASADAGYVTGHRFAVDGGLLAQQRSPEVDIFGLDRFPKVRRR